MEDRRVSGRQLRQLDTSFWAAATLSVPVMLSTAALASLFMEMAIVAAGAGIPAARLIAIATVGLSLATLSVLLIRKPAGTPQGIAVGSLITLVFVVVAAVSTT